MDKNQVTFCKTKVWKLQHSVLCAIMKTWHHMQSIECVWWSYKQVSETWFCWTSKLRRIVLFNFPPSPPFRQLTCCMVLVGLLNRVCLFCKNVYALLRVVMTCVPPLLVLCVLHIGSNWWNIIVKGHQGHTDIVLT